MVKNRLSSVNAPSLKAYKEYPPPSEITTKKERHSQRQTQINEHIMKNLAREGFKRLSIDKFIRKVFSFIFVSYEKKLDENMNWVEEIN